MTIPMRLRTSSPVFAGTQLLLPVEAGKVVLGTWQRIVLIELDGPKTRTIMAGSAAAQALEE